VAPDTATTHASERLIMNTSPTDGPDFIVIPSDLKEARRVQRHIEKKLNDTAFDAREIFGIRLALEEALVNAIKHGNRLDPLKKVEIQYTVEKDRFDIQITDEGPGYVPEHVPDCKSDENLTRPGGRGLFLMRHYMSEVVVRPPGNQLFMSKVHVNGGPQP
jgi:serine/threonine-protein kinase RsbW